MSRFLTNIRSSVTKNAPTASLLGLLGAIALSVLFATPASAQVAPVNPDPVAPVSNPIVAPAAPAKDAPTNTPAAATAGPKGPTGPTGTATNNGTASLNLDLGSALNKPSQSILIILLITILSVAPALLIMLTSFTRIIIVLGLTRNALGISGIPPNQVLVGLALFISLFIMSPVFTQMNDKGVQPYLKGEITQSVAFERASQPLKEFMLKHTRADELSLFSQASGKTPDKPENVSLTVLCPAFILSELKTAFIIGFVIFIPFLVIDIIVSSSLMSMGMMMLPPQMISLPFKLLLFVLVDGWALVVRSLITSFN